MSGQRWIGTVPWRSGERWLTGRVVQTIWRRRTISWALASDGWSCNVDLHVLVKCIYMYTLLHAVAFVDLYFLRQQIAYFIHDSDVKFDASVHSEYIMFYYGSMLGYELHLR